MKKQKENTNTNKQQFNFIEYLIYALCIHLIWKWF